MANNTKEMLNILFWNFIFLILPYVSAPLTEPYELPKVVIFLSITFLTIAYNVGILSRPIKNVRSNTMDVLLMAYFGVNIVSSLLNDSIYTGWWGQYYRYQGLATLLGLYGIYWLSSRISISNKYIFNIILISGILNIFFIFYQYFFENSLRLSANFGNANFAAEFLAVSASANNFWYLWPLFLVGAWLTQSRTGLIGLCIVIVLKYFNKRFGVYIILLSILGILVFFPIKAESHFDNRYIIWTKAIEAVTKKPLFGYGRENFVTAFNTTLDSSDFDLKSIRVDKAHNETLEVLVSTGFVGAILYYWIIVYALVKLWKNRQNKYVYQNFIILTTFVVMSQFNVLNINQYIFLYFALGSARGLKIR